jgi:hypothetical protein
MPEQVSETADPVASVSFVLRDLKSPVAAISENCDADVCPSNIRNQYVIDDIRHIRDPLKVTPSVFVQEKPGDYCSRIAPSQRMPEAELPSKRRIKFGVEKLAWQFVA